MRKGPPLFHESPDYFREILPIGTIVGVEHRSLFEERENLEQRKLLDCKKYQNWEEKKKLKRACAVGCEEREISKKRLKNTSEARKPIYADLRRIKLKRF